jgi:hypothetical protein
MRFEDPYVEGEYVENLAKQNGERAKIGTRAALLALGFYFLVEVMWLLPHPTEWTLDLSNWRLIERVLLFACLITMRATPAKYLEYVLCGAEIVCVATVLIGNELRLKRHSLIDDVETKPSLF